MSNAFDIVLLAANAGSIYPAKAFAYGALKYSKFRKLVKRL